MTKRKSNLIRKNQNVMYNCMYVKRQMLCVIVCMWNDNSSRILWAATYKEYVSIFDKVWWVLQQLLEVIWEMTTNSYSTGACKNTLSLGVIHSPEGTLSKSRRCLSSKKWLSQCRYVLYFIKSRHDRPSYIPSAETKPSNFWGRVVITFTKGHLSDIGLSL